MNYMKILKACLVLSLVTWGFTSAKGADQQSELQLEPCTIELVDGTTVEGQIAVQFDMPDHLVVYSPRLATVRSFLKTHVHALSVEGKREQLNPKRELTDGDKQMLGRVEWPDAPPKEGRQPAYTTETWEAPRQLLVWANPGQSGQFEDPKNWLLNGERMKQWPRPTGEFFGFVFFSQDGTDFLFPASPKGYSVRPRRSNARARHITAEAGADAEIRLNNGTGNMWVSEHGSFNGGGGANLGGDKHTFFINGRRYTGEPPTTPQRFAELMGAAKHFARKWTVRKEDPAASITLIGSFRSGDETHWVRGVTILDESSVISIGPRCVQTVNTEATLVLRSGAVLGKNHNQLYKNDMRLKGSLMAGTPDEPLTRDCFLGLSIKDSKARAATGRLAKRHAGPPNVRGLTVAPDGRIQVHAADSAKACLVIAWHGTTPGGDDGGKSVSYDQLPPAERTTNVNFFGDQVIENVMFDGVGKGDIRLLNPDIRQKWQRIGFGKNNTAKGDALFTKFEPGKETAAQIARWHKQHETGRQPSWAGDAVRKGAAYPRILPSGGTFAAGEEIQVQLEALGDREIRYTTDGRDSEKGQVYDKPLTLTDSTTVKAGCFHTGIRADRKWRHVDDKFTFVDGTRAPDEPGETNQGLALRVYDVKSFDKLHAEQGEPVHSQTVDQFTLNVPEGRDKKQDGYAYTGFIEVGESGIYRFYTRTEGASRLYIGDRLVVDNHRRYRFDWQPAGKAPLESWGSLKLKPGKHAIRVEYLRGRGFAWWKPQEDEPFEVSYEGPGVEKRPIPADVLKH